MQMLISILETQIKRIRQDTEQVENRTRFILGGIQEGYNDFLKLMSDFEGSYLRANDNSYEALQLNMETDRGWAVVGVQSGAVAVGDDGRLLMYMTEDEARLMAQALSNRSVSAEKPDVPEDRI